MPEATRALLAHLAVHKHGNRCANKYMLSTVMLSLIQAQCHKSQGYKLFEQTLVTSGRASQLPKLDKSMASDSSANTHQQGRMQKARPLLGSQSIKHS